MLVQALCLRRLGRRLSPEALRAAVPLEGQLRMVDNYYEGRDGRGRQICLLMPPTGTVPPLVELYSAKLIRIEARGILIAGVEETWDRKRKVEYRQTLWAWPLPPPQPKQKPREAGSPEVQRLLEALDTMA